MVKLIIHSHILSHTLQACDYLWKLGLKLIHVSKTVPWKHQPSAVSYKAQQIYAKCIVILAKIDIIVGTKDQQKQNTHFNRNVIILTKFSPPTAKHN